MSQNPGPSTLMPVAAHAGSSYGVAALRELKGKTKYGNWHGRFLRAIYPME